MDVKKYTEANRKAWNEVMPRHEAIKKDAKRQFLQPGFSCLDQTVTEKLREIGLQGKRVAQVCCNDGVETLSLKNLGAASAAGFDISDGAIDSARQLAKVSGIDSEFVRTDIYEIPEKYERQFDLVFISAGVFTWFPDLTLFFKKVSWLLKEGGAVLIYEMHPFLNMLDQEAVDFRIKYTYFNDSPQMYDDGITYMGNETYDSSPAYNFDPKLSDIFNGLIENGFQLCEFKEYPFDLSPLFERMEGRKIECPLSLLIHAKI